MDGIKTMHPQDFILPGAVRMYFSGILGFFGIILISKTRNRE